VLIRPGVLAPLPPPPGAPPVIQLYFFFFPNKPPPPPKNCAVVVLAAAWFAASLTFAAAFFFCSFFVGAFSTESGATEPGVPGMIEPCLDAPSPAARAKRLRSRASSWSRSFTADARNALTTSLVILIGAVGVLEVSEIGVGSLAAEPEAS